MHRQTPPPPTFIYFLIVTGHRLVLRQLHVSELLIAVGKEPVSTLIEMVRLIESSDCI